MHQFLSSGQGSVQSLSASWDDFGWAFLGKLCVSLFPWWVPILCLDSKVIPLWLFFACVCDQSFNLPLVLIAEWLAFLRSTAVRQGWNGYYWIKNHHRKLILEKKIFSLYLPGSEPTTFWSRAWQSATELSSCPTRYTQNRKGFVKKLDCLKPGKLVYPRVLLLSSVTWLTTMYT